MRRNTSALLAIGTHLLLDFLHMIEVVSECDVNVSEGNRRNLRYDLIRGKALVFMPNDDVLNAHTMTRDTRSTATSTWRFDDSFVPGFDL